ncbi:hypothetical protein BCR42DRAFT_366532 [Absidia repens]|uniref:Uncharacterized protein n=1 Tax=Absidia repens TaxID=90262 RepID=A0A1X2IVH1_9FUNG|nr:hypothetical protein BCR42DRAFT_366532 [Absidia repens]
MVSLSIPSSSNEVCATPGCIQSALRILADVDFNLDPCSDFYQYTCVGTFQYLRNANMEVIENILTGSYEDVALESTAAEEKAADKANFRLVKDFFQSCMNQDHRDKLGVQPLQDFIFPLKNDNLHDILTKLELNGISGPIFSAGVNPDEKNPNQNVVTLAQPNLGLPSKEYFKRKDVTDVYRHTMKALSRLILPTLDNEDVDKIVDFETQLADISIALENLQDPLAVYNPVTLENLEKRYAFFDWRHFFEQVTPENRTPHKIILLTPGFFDALAKIWAETNDELIKSYTLLSTVRKLASLLNTSTTDSLQDLNGKLTGQKSQPPLTLTCSKFTNDAFGDILGHYFINAAFDDHNLTSEKVQEQLETIHTIYAQRLELIDWLDEATRRKALEKIKKMAIKSMYSTVSPDIRSPLSLNEFYSGLVDTINPDTHFRNSLAVGAWRINKKWSSLNNPVNKDEWFMEPQTVNAYFSPSFNQVVVPAGILQPPFFNINSEPLSLGGIGVVIGHELTHGFDNSGRLYDGDGVLTQWWSNATKEQFNEKAQCFIDQYSNFSIQGPDGKEYPVNGKMTLGENLADNGGISLAYEAFSKTPQARLSGIDISPEALFFINFGRVWCAKERPERSVRRILGDVHSPARVRVNAAVQNMPQFAEVFNCPEGSPMNPTSKCKLW